MRKFNLLLFCGLFCIAIGGIASPQTYGPIKKGELLWNVATKLRSDNSVSQYQIMIALLKANPTAFSVTCNINSLKTGSTVRVPSLAEIQALSPEEARKEYQRQDGEWKTYRRSKRDIVCPTTATTPLPQEPTNPATATTTTLAQSQEPPVATPADTVAVPSMPVETTAVEKTTPKELTEPKPAPEQKVSTVTPPATANKTEKTVEPAPAASLTDKTTLDNTSTMPKAEEPKVAVTTEIPKKTSDSTSTISAQNSEMFPSLSIQLFSIRTIVAIIVCALLSAFLIGWILHKITQRRKHPPTETLENHPLFDSIDKVLLTGQLPKNQ